MPEWSPNPKYPSPKIGEPPLHRAARLGDKPAITRLVQERHDVNAVFNIGLDPSAYPTEVTPLMVAAGSGEGATVETVQTLIDLGADPKLITPAGSAAARACLGLGWNYKPGGDAARLSLLLAAGSPLPRNEMSLNRILCEAAKADDSERLVVLLEHGLNPDGYWSEKEAEETHRQMMERMARFRASQPDPFAAMPEEVRAQLAAITEKNESDLFERETSGPSGYEIPLFLAAAAPSAACFKALLEAGADPRVRDNSGRTAMYWAASDEAVHLLVKAGVPIEGCDCYEWSPLVNAVSEGTDSFNKIRALLKAGADIHATHDQGYTVFMSALGSQRDTEVLKLLVEYGADPHAVSDLGYNAFHAAVDVNGCANAEPSVRATLTYLKELGVNIEHRNRGGQTPLARALHEGTGTEVQVLCDLGANPNVTCPMHRCGGDSCGHSELPLIFHAAIGVGVHKNMKTLALLRAGADPLVTDEEGFTPLNQIVAALCSESEDYDAAYQSFFDGLGALRFGKKSMPRTCEEYIRHILHSLTRFVEEFGSRIPVPKTCDFDEQWRQERLSCIVSLCAYEAWTRAKRAG